MRRDLDRRRAESVKRFHERYTIDTEHAERCARAADEPRDHWDLIYEMWGATGVEPWPHTWSEYKRIFTGWRRHGWEQTGHLCATLANGLLPRRDRRAWRLSDFSTLFKPPPRWKATAAAFAEIMQRAFCRPPTSKDKQPEVDDAVDSGDDTVKAPKIERHQPKSRGAARRKPRGK